MNVSFDDIPEVSLCSFPGGSVVQRVGQATPAGVSIDVLAQATIVLTNRRIMTFDAPTEWSWQLSQLEAVLHGTTEPWTILPVPGLADHGVAVPLGDVQEFRRQLERACAELGNSAGAGEPLPGTWSRPQGVWSRPNEQSPLSGSATALVEPAPLGAPTTAADAAPLVVPSPLPAAADPGAPSGMPALPEAASVETTQRERLAAIEARGITAWFGDHKVLDRVSLVMPAGQVTALIGPSGCGKSTFLRILNRMHELIPSAALAGEVLLDGVDVYDPRRKLTDARRQVGMVFQKPNPFPAMSIYDNVVAGLTLTGTSASTEQKDELVETCLTKAGLWKEVRDRLRQPGGALSGGQQQRLCIARALAVRPRVLLMDEPCSALDPTSTRRIEQTIAELVAEVTIVIVTHNMQQAARVSDRCAFFLAEQGTPGLIVEHGPTNAMFHSPQDSRTSDYVQGRFG